MKIIGHGLLFLLVLISFANAQGNSSLINFQGGNYRFDLSMVNNLFLGVGTTVGAMGGDLGGLIPTSESLLWNPANLAFIRNFQYTLDACPALMLNPAAFANLDEQIRTAVDENIADMKADDFQMTDDDYPTMNMKIGNRGSVGMGSVAIRRGRGTFAAAMFQPLELNLNMIGTGLGALINAGEEGSALQVTMLSSIDLSMYTRVSIQGFSLGSGFFINPDWTLGLAVERLSGVAETSGHFQVEGIMVTAGNERAFNDPNDPGENSLFSNMTGRYKGSATGFRIGTTYKLNDSWGIGSVLALRQALEMKGDLKIEQWTIPALNLEAEGDEEILDPTHPEFYITQPNRTKSVENPTSKTLLLNLPGSLGVGISGRMGVIGIALNYTRYWGECAWHYQFKRDEADVHYSQGLKLGNAFRIGLDFKYIRLGLGLTTATLIDKTNEPTAETSEMVPIPNFTLGSGFKITRHLRTDFILFGVPSGTGKIAFYYGL